MVDKQLNSESSLSRKILLRVILKALTGIAVIFLGYIFMAGFFDEPETTKTGLHTFDLSPLTDNNAIYFKVNQREFLVIKSGIRYSVFWANDPIYGCRLEFLNSTIKPVCIDIEYNLDGYNSDRDQQLFTPEYEINSENRLLIYTR